MPTNLRTDAEVLAVLIESSLIGTTEAIRWADDEIQRPDAPLEELAELATSGTRHAPDVTHLLRAIPGSIDHALYLPRLCRALAQVVRSRPALDQRVVQFLYAMASADEVPDDVARDTIYLLDDAYDCVGARCDAARDDTRRKLLNFLDVSASGPVSNRGHG